MIGEPSSTCILPDTAVNGIVSSIVWRPIPVIVGLVSVIVPPPSARKTIAKSGRAFPEIALQLCAANHRWKPSWPPSQVLELDYGPDR